MPTRSTCAEVGVWKGDLSAEIVALVQPERLHLIDPWSKAAPGTGGWYSEPSTLEQTYMDSMHESVVSRFKSQIDAGTVIMHRATSDVAARSIADGSLDWVYLDGAHNYEAVRDDLRAYSAKVKVGGYLCGDDYANQSGVKRAVDEFLANDEFRLVQIRARQFIFQKQKAAKAQQPA